MSCSKLKDLTEKWLEWDNPNSESYLEIKKLKDEGKWDQLGPIMGQRLTFGTAGIRGKMGPGFGQMNDLVVLQTTQGLAHYLLQLRENIDVRKMGAVIGFDARHNSSKWAKVAAKVFVNLGFKVYLFSNITPTPFIPYTVVRRSAAIGIMITASHNPKEDNGYKVCWRNGPQILTPHDTNIQDSIMVHLVPENKGLNDETVLDYSEDLLVDPLEDSVKGYYSTLQEILYNQDNKEENAKLNTKIVYTPLHGVGQEYIDMAFEAAGFPPVIHVPKQKNPDPEFPTVTFPNPEEGKEALNLAFETAEGCGAGYVLANDPDADRLSLAQVDSGSSESGWKIFSGNELGALLGWWQFKVFSEKLYPGIPSSNLHFITSSVTSKMLKSIARTEGLGFHETLTGFKWMANKAYDLERDPNQKVMLAFEQSIGYMCGSRVLDKDGISAAVRVAELILFLEKNGMTCLDKLEELYKIYGYHCSNDGYFLYRDPGVINRIFDPIRRYNSAHTSGDRHYPDMIGKYKVVRVRDLCPNGHPYDSGTPNNVPDLPITPGSQFLTFTFDNGIVASLRTSGTEPKIKYYTEYCASLEESDWVAVEKNLQEFVEVFINDIIRPNENGLFRVSGS